MPELTDAVRGIAGREGVLAVMVASPDGLPIESAGAGVRDAEAMAALAVALLKPATRLAEAGAAGAFRRAVLEFGSGFAVLAEVRDGNWLLVVTNADADVGALLYDLRRENAALAALL